MLFVYTWDADTRTLTLESQHNLGLSLAFGLALDEYNGYLYVADGSTTIRYYATSDWSLAGSFTVTYSAVGIAVDDVEQIVYSGAGFLNNEHLSQYHIPSGTETTVHLEQAGGGSPVGVMGIGVDRATGHVHLTTGHGGDSLLVYDIQLNLVHDSGDLGGDPLPGCAFLRGWPTRFRHRSGIWATARWLGGPAPDPVNTATGNFTHQEADLALSTRSRPLVFSPFL